MIKKHIKKIFKQSNTFPAKKYYNVTYKLVDPNININKNKPDKLMVALCCIAKNENLYIREWVEYYKNLGISKIFIYDNNELDGERFEDVIDDYIDSGFVEVIDKRGTEKGLVYDNNDLNLQGQCYLDCYNNRCKDFDWVCFFDVDEFLTFRNGYNLKSYLSDNRFDNYDTIAVGWEIYGDNGLIYYDNRPVQERFTKPSIDQFHSIKSIVRTGKKPVLDYQQTIIHIFRVTGSRICRADYKKYGHSSNLFTYKSLANHNCILKHYKTKSAEEYIKRHLGRHWGTTKARSMNLLSLDDLKRIYFRFCEWSKEKSKKFDEIIVTEIEKNIADGNINKTPTNTSNLQNYKKVVYTCITGNYDNLLEPEYISPDYDYICFTDNKKLQSNIWKIKYIPDDLLNLSKVKQQRNIKINTHKYLPEYDLSIWVDSSVKLNNNINNVLCSLDFNNYNIFITKHPERNCIYKEAKACIDLKKDNKYVIETELRYFESEGMPENFGLLETNVIIKLHNDPKCIELMELWSKYLNIFSHRDQISLPFALWKLKYDKLYYLPIGFNHTTYFDWIGGLHKKINICIIHYNTPELTNALIKSINKHVKRAYIYLFDNSDKNPFTYKYDNLEYLDNTNGQYINFNEWLDNYPTRFQTREHIGNYGSARHSISIQKCMEIIDDNFILMDSDILLKRDVSGFINSNYIYVGETEQQGNGKYRVLPFCLFINVKMCKKYNVPWFDANYMHGLHLTKEADKYDTGGAFYIHTINYPHKDVTLKSFIIHYKGGSWEEKYMKEHNLTLTSKEWLEINKKYWE